MTGSPFEDEVRSALAAQAARVPEEAAIRLRRIDYKPRRGASPASIRAAVGAGLVAVGVVIATVYALGTGTPPGSGHRTNTTVELAGYRFTLPRGAVLATAAATWCEPIAHSAANTIAQGGGIFTIVGQGCLNLDVKPTQMPARAQRVAVGAYTGFIVSDPAAGRVTLYVRTSSANAVVLTSTRTGLSEAQLITMARIALSTGTPRHS